MYIFELTKPGNWLESEDKEWSWKIERLLDHLEFAFYEAGNDSNLLIVFYVQIMPDDLVMQLHRF